VYVNVVEEGEKQGEEEEEVAGVARFEWMRSSGVCSVVREVYVESVIVPTQQSASRTATRAC
jgi:hypothetical protein